MDTFHLSDSRTVKRQGRLRQKRSRGFTLIEILVVIGLVAILASVVLIAINPARQFAQARNSQRIANVNALLNAVGNRVAENRGLFTSGSCWQPLPATSTNMSTSEYDIRPCLVPTYISELPMDPITGFNTCTSLECSGGTETYDTHYTIAQDTLGRITICAPGAYEQAIGGSGPYCLTR